MEPAAPGAGPRGGRRRGRARPRCCVRHLRALPQALGGADLEVEDWLGARDLAEVIRTAYDPHSQAQLARPPRRRCTGAAARRHGGARSRGQPAAWPGPVYAEARPGTYIHDGAVSVSYWVQSWPRSQAYCTALAPLLGDGQPPPVRSRWCIEPLGPRAAERAVMRERTARHVAVRMRQRTGQIVPSTSGPRWSTARSQDAERAAGHGLVRFAGYATVTAPTPPWPRTRARRWKPTPPPRGSSCAACGSRRTRGFALAALPLGLGLPKRRW